jgi:hypothetical protein
MIPARFSAAQEREWVDRMVARLSAQDRRRRPGDADLSARAGELSGRYLGGLARPASVNWAANQNSRWGSCTPADGTIRLSTRLQGMPAWVIDYVLLHELAHLLEQGHGPRFWSLLAGYPRTERARGYLEGFAAARDLRIGEDGPTDGEVTDDADGADDHERADDGEHPDSVEDTVADDADDDVPDDADEDTDDDTDTDTDTDTDDRDDSGDA